MLQFAAIRIVAGHLLYQSSVDSFCDKLGKLVYSRFVIVPACMELVPRKGHMGTWLI